MDSQAQRVAMCLPKYREVHMAKAILFWGSRDLPRAGIDCHPIWYAEWWKFREYDQLKDWLTSKN